MTAKIRNFFVFTFVECIPVINNSKDVIQMRKTAVVVAVVLVVVVVVEHL